MTDRIRGFIVTLDKDYRDDDIDAVRNALQQIKGVISVKPKVAEIESHMAYARARHDLHMKLYDALKDDK